MPRLVTFVALAAVVTLAACGGGGGQLAAGGSGSATTTSAPATGARPVPVDDLGGPTTAASAARVLARVEHGLRTDGQDATALAKLGRAQQLAYRAVAAHPAWTAKVLADVPSSVRAAVRANIDAGAALNALTGSAPVPSGFPDWQILTPPPAATLRDYYDEAERASGISWAYLAAIHLVETRMGRIRGLSSAGAQGPMQFIPATWARYGEGDINDNRQAILAAGRYLKASNGVTDIDRALFSYNNDDRYVAAVKAYASVMLADEHAYDGYHGWQVFSSTADGTFLLPEGFHA
jgi:soluble lytic murein transglycosylase-like protein